MSLKVDNKVDQFVRDTMSLDMEKGEIVASIKKIVVAINPDVEQLIMYGGIMFKLKSKLITGIFVRKNHISVEFGNGNTFSDPKNVLEGKGEYRRHLKLRSKQDITEKEVEFYVSQAFNM